VSPTLPALVAYPALPAAWSRRETHSLGGFFLGGFLASVAWVLFSKTVYYDLYEMIPVFAVGLLLTLVVSRLTGGQQTRRNTP
jgi:Na+/proline symporter